jgi:hypothetical protein
MKNKMKQFFLFALAIILAAPPATAAVQCYDTVTDVVVHSNGRIFFTTANACSLAWCELKGDAIFVNGGYAMLMTAKIKNKTVYFQWDILGSCDAKNPAYTIPDFMILK